MLSKTLISSFKEQNKLSTISTCWQGRPRRGKEAPGQGPPSPPYLSGHPALKPSTLEGQSGQDKKMWRTIRPICYGSKWGWVSPNIGIAIRYNKNPFKSGQDSVFRCIKHLYHLRCISVGPKVRLQGFSLSDLSRTNIKGKALILRVFLSFDSHFQKMIQKDQAVSENLFSGLILISKSRGH